MVQEQHKRKRAKMVLRLFTGGLKWNKERKSAGRMSGSKSGFPVQTAGSCLMIGKQGDQFPEDRLVFAGLVYNDAADPFQRRVKRKQ